MTTSHNVVETEYDKIRQTLLAWEIEQNPNKDQQQISTPGAREQALKDLPTAIFNTWSISHSCTQDSERHSYECLIDEMIPGTDRRYIALALLNSVMAHTSEDDLKGIIVPKIYEMFDIVIGKDIYPQLNLETKQQTHEKRAKLSGLYSDLEREFEEILDGFSTLNDFRSFRTHVNRLFNGGLGGKLLPTFVSRSLTQNRLPSLLAAVADYIEDDVKTSMSPFESAIEACNEFEEAIATCQTQYGGDFLSTALTRIRHHLEEDFSKNPLSQPPKLKITARPKKYPIGNQNETFKFMLRIQNETKKS